MRLNSVRNRLLLLFGAITVAAIAFVYLYVVPQLRTSLTAEKLGRVQEAGIEHVQRLADPIRRDAPPAELRRTLRAVAQRTDARVTVLGVRSGSAGAQPAFVIGDSELERTAIAPAYPAGSAAAASGRVATAVETVDGERLGEAAVPRSDDGEVRWVAVLSVPLADVDANVALIRRQILIAGGIAILLALAAAWLAARAHARRLRRLEAAAEKVAEGDFRTPIPVDSGDEVGQLARSLDEMQRRLARLDSARREFIANASHELRTPIFSLGGFIELLEDENPDPAEREEFMRTMREQVARLTKLTADLLDLSKLDADALAISSEPITLAQLARRVAAEFAPAAELHRSPIRVEGDGDAVAAADPDRVAQIVRILIDNSLTHTPEGTAISITTKLKGGTAVLTVKDDGPGIDAAARERVFERFFTGDEPGGSGLGLAIARELAVRMAGGISMTSRRGHTQFTLSLPTSPRIPA